MKHRLSQFKQQQQTKAAIRVDFYERFRKLCASKGLERKVFQTQQEFAIQAIHQFNADLIAIGSSAFPQELVNSFYSVRFGGQKISEMHHETD